MSLYLDREPHEIDYINMTHVDIETHFNEGRGSLEMRPRLDEVCAKVIQGHGITGISRIFDGEDERGESEGIAFDNIDRARFDETAQSIADVLGQTGCIVTLIEKPQVIAAPAQPKHRANRILSRAWPKLAQSIT